MNPNALLIDFEVGGEPWFYTRFYGIKSWSVPSTSSQRHSPPAPERPLRIATVWSRDTCLLPLSRSYPRETDGPGSRTTYAVSIISTVHTISPMLSSPRSKGGSPITGTRMERRTALTGSIDRQRRVCVDLTRFGLRRLIKEFRTGYSTRLFGVLSRNRNAIFDRRTPIESTGRICARERSPGP